MQNTDVFASTAAVHFPRTDLDVEHRQEANIEVADASLGDL